MTELTAAERKVVAFFLRKLSEKQGNAGCNDFCFEGDVGLAIDEWGPIAVNVQQQREPEDREKTIGSYSAADFEVVDYLASKLEAE